MKRISSALIASILMSSSNVIAQESSLEKLPIAIAYFTKGENLRGSFVLRPEESLDLYDKEGNLLDTLLFKAKHDNLYRNGTSSVYSSANYMAVVDDRDSAFTTVTEIPHEPKPGLNLGSDKGRLTKQERIEAGLFIAELYRRSGKNELYNQALKNIEKLRELPDNDER
ncbi:MAG: hypothetical protein KME03_15320 [Aphanocapsa lilacina HA4352-LM1]|jgi:hypothetical protein|nr:hypothetical protein [Aphanocapsa lilacina HA4352-LM1]